MGSPTRFRDGNRPSSLSLLFINNLADIYRLDYLSPPGLSDQRVLRVEVEGSRPVLPFETAVKWYHRLEEAKALQLARDLDWDVHETDTVDSLHERLVTSVLRVDERVFLTKIVDPIGNPKWLTLAISRGIVVERRSRAKYLCTRTQANFAVYKTQSNRLRSLIRRAHRAADLALARQTGDRKKKFLLL